MIFQFVFDFSMAVFWLIFTPCFNLPVANTRNWMKKKQTELRMIQYNLNMTQEKINVFVLLNEILSHFTDQSVIDTNKYEKILFSMRINTFLLIKPAYSISKKPDWRLHVIQTTQIVNVICLRIFFNGLMMFYVFWNRPESNCMSDQSDKKKP